MKSKLGSNLHRQSELQVKQFDFRIDPERRLPGGGTTFPASSPPEGRGPSN